MSSLTLDEPDSFQTDLILDHIVQEDYISPCQNEDWANIDKDAIESTPSNDKLVQFIYSASKIPSFSDLKILLMIRDLEAIDYDRLMVLMAVAMSINPTLSWWMISNSSGTIFSFLVCCFKFSVLNPGKMAFLCAAYRRSNDVKKLLGLITST